MGEKEKMERKLCCPRCGCKELQVTTETNTQTTGSDYSAGQGCLGFLLFGPLGLLCGACGQGKTTNTTQNTYWICPKCGKRFENPDDIEKKINATQSPVFAALTVIGAAFAVLLFFLLLIATEGEIPLVVAGLLCTIPFGLCTLFGFLFKKANDAQYDKLVNELNELESSMKKFEDA